MVYDRVSFDLEGGPAPEAFTCTGCRQARGAGADFLEVHILGGIFGPLCLDCWPKVPASFERVAAQPGVYLNVELVRLQVMGRYNEARARGVE